jgi:cytidine deaminase
MPAADAHSFVSSLDAATRLRQDTSIFLGGLERRRRHHIASALLLDDGRQILGINIISNFGPASVCAEQVALGEALKTLGSAQIIVILTLRATFRPGPGHEIVPPCGRCREILFEYARDSLVAVADPGRPEGLDLMPLGLLLPRPFHRRVESEELR